MPSNAGNSPVSESFCYFDRPSARDGKSPDLQSSRKADVESTSQTSNEIRRRSASFDGNPSQSSPSISKLRSGRRRSSENDTLRENYCSLIAGIMNKIREVGDQPQGASRTRLLASIEFDIHSICLKQHHQQQTTEELRHENALLKRRMDILRLCIEEEQKKAQAANNALQMELFRTQEQMVREREENDALKKRLHAAQMELTEARRFRRSPFQIRDEAPDSGDSLLQGVCRMLCDLRLQQPTTVRELARMMESAAASDGLDKENININVMSKTENGFRRDGRSCLSLTQENLTEHEKQFTKLATTECDDVFSQAATESSDASECTVVEHKNLDACSVTSRLTSSTLSSLKSVEDRKFREGLAMLDAHINRLQSKFNRSTSSSYPSLR